MNRLSKIVSKIQKLPQFMQRSALSYTLGNAVKFVGTAGVKFESISHQEVITTLANKPKVQNHIKQVHAVATALLAETATGILLGMNLPDGHIPLLKNMSIDYTKRSQGAQRAIATLSPEAISEIISEPKGDIIVPVTIVDSVGTEVVKVNMNWAWIPKK